MATVAVSYDASYDQAAAPSTDAQRKSKGSEWKTTSSSVGPDGSNMGRRGSDADSVKSNASKASSGTAGSQRSGSRSKTNRRKNDEANGSGAGSSGKKAEKTTEEIEAERKQKEGLKIIAETWALANKSNKHVGDDAGASSSTVAEAKSDMKKRVDGKAMKASGKNAGSEGHESASGSKKTDGRGGLQIPDSFEGMMRFNAGMTGANMTYIEIMLRSFHSIVSDVCSIGTLQEQTDFLALEMRREVVGDYKINEFRPCLMASMAALIPRQWNSTCEQAWGWFWESVEAQLKDSLQQASVHEKFVLRYVKGLTDKDFDDIGTSQWKKLFKQEREAELRHKQPTATFVRIAMLAIQFTAKIFEDPFRMKGEISEHALKHILHQVEPRLFAVFVVQMEEEIRAHAKDESVTAGVNWALSVIASLMARTVQQTSNPILVAAVRNDEKNLIKAINACPRGVRAQKQLHV